MAGILNLLAMAGSHILSAIAGLMALSMISYSGYVIYDSVHTEQAAFTSWDLEQYRPVQEEEEGGLSFDSLFGLNPDAVGWITLEDTHIDYPLVQGRDDLEYSYKDVYGETSLTGSIYLAAANQKDLSDSYNLIFGHHMTNGAMFGDIEKYEDVGFMDSHRSGVLLTGDTAYDLHVFAYAQADAYDNQVYGAGDRDAEAMREFLEYIQTISPRWEDGVTADSLADAVGTYLTARDENIEEHGSYRAELMPSEPDSYGAQIVALSTCRAASTNGRQILFATMRKRSAPVPAVMINDNAVPLAAGDAAEVAGDARGGAGQILGHGQGETWSLLNLLCVAMMLYLTFPLLQLGSKYGRVKMMRKANSEAAAAQDAGHAEDPGADEAGVQQPVPGIQHYETKDLAVRSIAGAVIELALSAGALIWFLRTENIRSSIAMVNGHTPVFLLLFAVLWLADVLCFRYQLPIPKVLRPETM